MIIERIIIEWMIDGYGKVSQIKRPRGIHKNAPGPPAYRRTSYRRTRSILGE